jgi:hypothetical protein
MRVIALNRTCIVSSSTSAATNLMRCVCVIGEGRGGERTREREREREMKISW